nr:MAG TPA: Protein of unknown function (DUF2612) [Caudoviricetes sp.]
MITPDKEYYRDLITSEYRLSKKFNSMVRAMVDYGCILDAAVLKIVEKFDIDEATGNQLDIIGECVGVTRSLNFEPTALAYSIIEGPSLSELLKDTGKESQYTIIQTPIAAQRTDTDVISGYKPAEFDSTKERLISDDIYRIMIKARIIQNIWKGNATELYEMWDVLFPKNMGLQIQDNQDMSFNIVLIGDYPEIMKELIMHGYIIPKPEGVRINMLSFVSTDGLPIFAYDYNTINYSGYTSHWLQTKETEG